MPETDAVRRSTGAHTIKIILDKLSVPCTTIMLRSFLQSPAATCNNCPVQKHSCLARQPSILPVISTVSSSFFRTLVWLICLFYELR